MASVSLEGISKIYRARREAVRALVDVDLTVQDGELLVVVGPSGCGKTTTLRVIAGLEKVKAKSVPELPLAFFTWHDKIEDQHKEHTWDELRACYETPAFREAPFVRAGVAMLDGVKVFWDGLNDLRDHPRARVA